MNDIPLHWAMLLGIVIGLLLFGPVKRWLVTLRRTLQERRRQRGMQRQDADALLLIFATMHPAPWLLLVGLPYAVYALWTDPMRLMWASILAGAVLGPALLGLYGTWNRRRTPASRVAHEPIAAGPDE